eukprot:scaffold61232_cov27-Cyclotella_meneghiniana.AAC.1
MAKTLWCHISPETTPVKLFTSVSAHHPTTVQVHHFDRKAKRFHDMSRAMQIVEKMARANGVWKP